MSDEGAIYHIDGPIIGIVRYDPQERFFWFLRFLQDPPPPLPEVGNKVLLTAQSHQTRTVTITEISPDALRGKLLFSYR